MEELSKKLNKLGYNTYISIINDITYIKGGYTGNDIEKNLSIDIRIYKEYGNFVFINWDKQISNNINFKTEKECIDYIKKRFPL